jgi:hypothetical protein
MKFANEYTVHELHEREKIRVQNTHGYKEYEIMRYLIATKARCSAWRLTKIRSHHVIVIPVHLPRLLLQDPANVSETPSASSSTGPGAQLFWFSHKP